jgi:isochorismate synthase
LILDKISSSHSKELPFVCFRKPKATKVKGYFCQDSSLTYSNSFEEEGFVFAPFDDSDEAIIFLNKKSEIIEEPFIEKENSINKSNLKTIFSDQEAHINLVKKGIDAIHESQFKKVVLSRKEVVTVSDFDCISVFERLLNSYQNAFVYVWYHPKVGFWMGATPEKLVILKGNQFKTMALASTQPYQGKANPDWGEKEKEEHRYVVEYIENQIKDQNNGIILDQFSISPTYTSKAGNLLHLKADIQGVIGAFSLKNLLQTLHPTPAVCGLPKQPAKEFILESENYKRSFYTGFLGEINTDKETALFVNLRCVEIQENSAIIYVGGGITANSNAEKEWEETIHKTQTIKSVL